MVERGRGKKKKKKKREIDHREITSRKDTLWGCAMYMHIYIYIYYGKEAEGRVSVFISNKSRINLMPG